jgi:hypothetical protein
MKRNFSVALALSALVLTCGCKKTITSSVDLTKKAKADFATNPDWQAPGQHGRLIRYDIGDGNFSDCILAYDLGTGEVSLTQFSETGSTSVYTPQVGFPMDNGTTLSVSQYFSDVTDDYAELGGVHIIPFDATGDFHEDHLMLYIPGRGILYLIHYNGNGTWHQDWYSNSGIGGYDLKGAGGYDKIITYDYGNRVKDYLVCYRPGAGFVWFIKSNHGTGPNGSWSFSAQYAASGIGGYDMKGPTDQLVCIGGPQNGYMNLAAFRPGYEYMWLIQHGGPGQNSFGGTWSSRSGFPGFNFTNAADRMVVSYTAAGFSNLVTENDFNMICYRPGAGISAIEQYAWNSTVNPNSTSLQGPASLDPNINGSGLMTHDPYAPGANTEGDHILCFSKLGYNTSLLFWTNNNGITQSQLYYQTYYNYGLGAYYRVY